MMAEEWAKTSVDFLAELARSMPKRCQAVNLCQKSLGLRPRLTLSFSTSNGQPPIRTTPL